VWFLRKMMLSSPRPAIRPTILEVVLWERRVEPAQLNPILFRITLLYFRILFVDPKVGEKLFGEIFWPYNKHAHCFWVSLFVGFIGFGTKSRTLQNIEQTRNKHNGHNQSADHDQVDAVLALHHPCHCLLIHTSQIPLVLPSHCWDLRTGQAVPRRDDSSLSRLLFG